MTRRHGRCSRGARLAAKVPHGRQEPFPGTVKGMGIEVGIRARLLWPGGVLIHTLDSGEAIKRTKALIADSSAPAIFAAALAFDGVLVRVDALERFPNGRWRLNETAVKEAVVDSGLEMSDVDGLATYPELPATGQIDRGSCI